MSFGPSTKTAFQRAIQEAGLTFVSVKMDCQPGYELCVSETAVPEANVRSLASYLRFVDIDAGQPPYVNLTIEVVTENGTYLRWN
jgi:hypothetical protein